MNPKPPEYYQKVFYSKTGNREIAVTVGMLNGEIVVSCSTANQVVSVSLSDDDARAMATHLTELADLPTPD